MYLCFQIKESPAKAKPSRKDTSSRRESQRELVIIILVSCNKFVCLFVCVFVCLCVCLFVCLFVCLLCICFCNY